jgi:hypothetical protein
MLMKNSPAIYIFEYNLRIAVPGPFRSSMYPTADAGLLRHRLALALHRSLKEAEPGPLPKLALAFLFGEPHYTCSFPSIPLPFKIFPPDLIPYHNLPDDVAIDFLHSLLSDVV